MAGLPQQRGTERHRGWAGEVVHAHMESRYAGGGGSGDEAQRAAGDVLLRPDALVGPVQEECTWIFARKWRVIGDQGEETTTAVAPLWKTYKTSFNNLKETGIWHIKHS